MFVWKGSILLITSISNISERRASFLKRSAKVWQNYVEFYNILSGIQLSPEQLAVVLQEEDQMIINGSAGSGKSLTLLYKLIKVMEQENEHHRILYCSFNTTLIEDARKRRDQSERYQQLKNKHTVDLMVFHNVAADILRQIGFNNVEYGRVSLSQLNRYDDLIARRTIALVHRYVDSKEYNDLPATQKLYKTHLGTFLKDEILWMKANGFVSEEAYLECERAGRGSNPRLTKEQRKTVFTLYEQYQQMLRDQFQSHLDLEDYALLLLKHMHEIPDSLKYDYIFVDEVQDLQSMQLKALVQLTKKSLVVSGDPKQRIYKRSPFTYRDLGLFIEGRKTKNLRVNYRSTKEIMKLASSISFTDEDNDREDSLNHVREGEKPVIAYFSTPQQETEFIIKNISELQKSDPSASIAVIHRHDDNLNDIRNCHVKNTLHRNFEVITTKEYGRKFELSKERKPVFYTDAYSVKGLEFDYVFIIHFDREHYPKKQKLDELEKFVERNSSSYELDEDVIINDEKKILYVAISRAKKKVWLTYNGKKAFRICQTVRDFSLNDYEAIGFDSSKYSS